MAKVELYDNSNKSRQGEVVPEQKEIPQIKLEGDIKDRKKSFGRRFMDSFFAEDLKSIRKYIVHDIVVPYGKQIISEAFSTWLWGKEGRGATGGPAVPWNTTRGNNYQRFFNSPVNSSSQANLVEDNSYEKSFNNYVDATNVLISLKDLAFEYPYASIGDLKMILIQAFKDDKNIASLLSPTPTDYSWGWDSNQLSTAQIMREGSGRYYIRYPKPQRIK